eukprot:GEMP01083703.1.p1 GENE.GEMP01083703.1~~GEMP01083703.1.p1  ORF type:complete len:144 (-),score=14.62 GEMP01083703.1:233-664(-)
MAVCYCGQSAEPLYYTVQTRWGFGIGFLGPTKYIGGEDALNTQILGRIHHIPKKNNIANATMGRGIVVDAYAMVCAKLGSILQYEMRAVASEVQAHCPRTPQIPRTDYVPVSKTSRPAHMHFLLFGAKWYCGRPGKAIALKLV